MKDRSRRGATTTRSLRAGLCVLACLAGAGPLLGQHSQPDTLRAQRIESAIKLDGVLDEPAWIQAPHISNFTQRELEENAPATERTEFAVLFDRTDRYLGVWCFDREPDKIVAQRMKWDFDTDSDDNVQIVLDTYGDRRNAYFFAVNPNASQADGLIQDNGRKSNSDWNGVWYTAATRTGQGWFAEIRIPFSTLKSSAANEQTWGLNIERNIRHKREQIRWQGWSRDVSLRQISRAGTLEGLRDLARMRIFEFRPYAVGGLENERDAGALRRGDLGLDFSYLVNPTVKMDFTVNPDFAQVESDEMIVNLTRFSISYPEKRQFFLEGKSFFDFSLGRAQPFYSRRIGSVQGQEAAIIAGARFLGKLGGTTLGAMDIQTNRTDLSNPTNFSLIRLKQDIGEESSVGLLAIGSAQSGHFNGTGGIDALFSTSKLFGDKNFQLGGAFAATYTSGIDQATGTAHRLFVSYPNDLVEFTGSWERAGPGFNPEVGFLSRTSYQVFSSELVLAPRPKFLPWIRQIEIKPFEFSYYIHDVSKAMQSVYLEFVPLAFSFKSGDAFEFNIQRSAENLTEPFEIREGFVIPTGRYWTDRASLQVETFEGRPFVAAAGFDWGEFYDGTSTEWEAGLAWKPSPHASGSLDYARTDIRLAAGAFAIDEVVARLNLSLSPRLFGSVFGQWNNDDDEILFNIRVTWIPKPGAYLCFVLNEFGDTLDPRWRLTKTVAMIKFVWYFSTR